MLVVVVYDISDDRRRTKLSDFLEGYGRRVQESVFECFLTLAEMRDLHQKITRRINLKEDNVRMYWISKEAVSQTLTLGSPPPEQPPNVLVI